MAGLSNGDDNVKENVISNMVLSGSLSNSVFFTFYNMGEIS